MTLAAELVAAIRADPAALEQLRELVGGPAPDTPDTPTTPTAPAFTVASLARELGRSERSIRGAIARGELQAVKRGRGYVIAADAVAAWAQAPPDRARPPSRRGRRPGPGPMTRALKA